MPDGLRGLCCRLQLDAADHAALLASAAAARLKGGKSLLHHAARAGQLALLRQVITAAPEAVRVADDAGHLPLHDGSDEAMVLLHEAAPDTAMAAGCHGKLMLHEAVARVVNRTVRAIPPLVRLLGNGSESVQEGAVNALANLAANNHANKAAIAAADAIAPLVRLLGSDSESVQEGAVNALANLAAKNHANKAAIAAADAIPPLVRLLGSGSESVQEGAARVLWNLAVNHANRAAAIAAAGSIPPLVRLLGSGRGEYVQMGAAGAL